MKNDDWKIAPYDGGFNKQNNLLSRYDLSCQAETVWKMLSNPTCYLDDDISKISGCIGILHDNKLYDSYVSILARQTRVIGLLQKFNECYEKELQGKEELFIPCVLSYSLLKNRRLTKSLTYLSVKWEDVIKDYFSDNVCKREYCYYNLDVSSFDSYRTIYGLIRGMEANESLRNDFLQQIDFSHPVLKEYLDDFKKRKTEQSYAEALFTPFIDAWMKGFLMGIENSRVMEIISVLYLKVIYSECKIHDENIILIFKMMYNIYAYPVLNRYQKRTLRIRKKLEDALRKRLENTVRSKITFYDFLIDIFMDEKCCAIREESYHIFTELNQYKVSEIDSLLAEYFTYSYLKSRIRKAGFVDIDEFETCFIEDSVEVEDYFIKVQEDSETLTIKEKKSAAATIVNWQSFFLYAQNWILRKNCQKQENEYSKQVPLPAIKDNDKEAEEIVNLRQQLSEIEKNNLNIKNLLSEIATLKKEKRQMQAQLDEAKKDRTELIGLRNYIYEESSNVDVSETEDIESMAEYLEHNVKGIIVGGHPNFHNKLQKYIPGWKKYPPRTKVPSECVYGSDIIVFYTDHIDHSTYLGVIAEARRCSCKLLYVHNVNMEYTIKKIYMECEGRKE